MFEPLSDLTVVSPSNAEFSCRLHLGEPAADIHWFKAGTEILDNDKHRITVDGEVATLQVIECEPSDATDYRVEASNKLGEVRSDAILTVHGMLFF